MLRQIISLPAIGDTSLRLFFFSYGFFIISQFFIPSDRLWDFIFYLTVLPSLLLVCLRHFKQLRPLLRLPEAGLAAGLIGWLCLSLLWQPNLPWLDALHLLRHALLTSLFLLASVIFFSLHHHPQQRWFWHVLVGVAGVTAIVSLIRFHSGFPEQAIRLESIGQLEQPILGAAVYGVVGLIAAALALRQNHYPWQQYRCAVIYLIISLLIVYTYSRGALIAFSIASLCLITLSASARTRLILCCVAMVIALLVPLLMQLYDLSLSGMMLRKSYRLDIWLATIEAISQRPWHGWGAAHPFALQLDDVTAVHMHNLILGTIYYGGVIAGVLLISLIGRLIWRVWQCRKLAEFPLFISLLLYCLLCVMSDNPRLITSPAPFWSLFWLPICYVLARSAALTPFSENHNAHSAFPR